MQFVVGARRLANRGFCAKRGEQRHYPYRVETRERCSHHTTNGHTEIAALRNDSRVKSCQVSRPQNLRLLEARVKANMAFPKYLEEHKPSIFTSFVTLRWYERMCWQETQQVEFVDLGVVHVVDQIWLPPVPCGSCLLSPLVGDFCRCSPCLTRPSLPGIFYRNTSRVGKMFCKDAFNFTKSCPATCMSEPSLAQQRQ